MVIPLVVILNRSMVMDEHALINTGIAYICIGGVIRALGVIRVAHAFITGIAYGVSIRNRRI